MKWWATFGITVLSSFIVLYEWPKMKPTPKKDKVVFIGVLGCGWILAIVLLFFPDLPNPGKLLDYLLQPLGKLLKS